MLIRFSSGTSFVAGKMHRTGPNVLLDARSVDLNSFLTFLFSHFYSSNPTLGSGGKSNHWSGNKRYRQVVSEMKAMYKHQDDKSAKTDLSRAIVDYVCNYGGRFLKKEGVSNSYYVLTRAEARKKTSQALRETKEPKWTL